MPTHKLQNETASNNTGNTRCIKSNLSLKEMLGGHEPRILVRYFAFD